MKRLPDLLKMASFPPKSVRSGICQQVVLEGDKADLTKLPIIQCWPLDGNLRSGEVFDLEAAERAAQTQTGTGRYITLGGIHTRNPVTGDRNIGMYRVQLFGPRTCAMHWHMHHDGARHFRPAAADHDKGAVASAAATSEREQTDPGAFKSEASDALLSTLESNGNILIARRMTARQARDLRASLRRPESAQWAAVFTRPADAEAGRKQVAMLDDTQAAGETKDARVDEESPAKGLNSGTRTQTNPWLPRQRRRRLILRWRARILPEMQLGEWSRAPYRVHRLRPRLRPRPPLLPQRRSRPRWRAALLLPNRKQAREPIRLPANGTGP